MVPAIGSIITIPASHDVDDGISQQDVGMTYLIELDTFALVVKGRVIGYLPEEMARRVYGLRPGG